MQLSAMEAKQNKSQRYSCSPESVGSKLDDDKRHKPLSSALQEVQFKGTLMERVAMQENRVLQLSLEMEEDYLSRSSSSTARLQENIKQGVPAKQDNDVRTLEKQDQVTYQKTGSRMSKMIQAMVNLICRTIVRRQVKKEVNNQGVELKLTCKSA
ncbi:hypothetical protein Scep_000023 [Stephania cephalantha]|uniref:Uncharacterized protein n=1 Tax=Stephania cephalantha TaxID=152367 RepID=A0AAP0L599_9MAGN